jgi:type I restriction enzyme S subunit
MYRRWMPTPLAAGDVLLTSEAPLGEVAYLPSAEQWCVGQRLFGLRAKRGLLDGRYLYYLLQTAPVRQQILSRASGSTVLGIRQAELIQVRLQVPSVAEQRQISATLGALDDKVESNRRLQQTAAALAQSLVGRATRGATEVGYEDAMSVVMGSAFKGSSFSAPGTGRPVLRIRDLKTFVSQTWTTESRADETVIQPGDIVVGMDAEFRATLWQGMPSLLNQRVCAFRPHDGVSRAFVLSALAPRLAFFERAKSGTTVIHLNKADIERFLVPRLDNDQHAQLTEQTEPLLDVVVNASAQSVRLAALRDALLPELLSGRIRVPEAGEAVESALA